MRKIIVAIEGTSPLIMNNPASMRAPGGGLRPIPTPEEESTAKRYLMPGTQVLCVRADHIHQCIKVAGRGFRIRGKESVAPYLSGSLEVQPEYISLGTETYEIDVRRAVVNKQGVQRARPLVWPWRASFELLYDETVFAEKFLNEVLHDQIMKRAGTGVGLLDYRPSKGGRYGRFIVTRWEL